MEQQHQFKAFQYPITHSQHPKDPLILLDHPLQQIALPSPKEMYLKTKDSFPVKLYRFASDVTFTPINWSEDGHTIFINEKALEPLLSNFSHSTKFSSFQMNLHLYGFRKVNVRTSRKRMPLAQQGDYAQRQNVQPVRLSEFVAKNFVRGNLELVEQMHQISCQAASQIRHTSNDEMSCIKKKIIKKDFIKYKIYMIKPVNNLHHKNNNQFNNNNHNPGELEAAESLLLLSGSEPLEEHNL